MSLYTEHEAGLMINSGGPGGDYVATDTVSRQFHRQLDDGTWAVVTIYAYGTQREVEEGAFVEYDVEEMVEYMVCSDPADPGGTEIDTDYRYENPFDIPPKSLEQALVWATNHIRNFDIDWVLWNGDTRTI